MTESAPERSAANQAAGEFVRFAVIGVFGFVVDAGTLKLLRALLHLDSYSARVLSFLTAATGNWMLNRRFTFRQAGDHAPVQQWLKYLGANGVGFVVNYATYVVVITYFAAGGGSACPLDPAGGLLPFAHCLADRILHDPEIRGVAAGSIAGLSFNFTLNKFVVFRARP